MKKVEPQKAEVKVLNWLDRVIARFKGNPPDEIHVYPNQAADVRQSRGRRDETQDTDEYLNFTAYKGIKIIVLGDSKND